MSSSYVRTKFKTWCTEVATAEGIPFYDTINLEHRPTDDVWFTVGFGVDFHEGTFCDPQYLENGFITVMVYALPGTGDIQAITAMEQIIPALMAKTDGSNRLVLEEYEPLREASGGSAENFYRVEVAVNYIHQL